jgi:hypothetical protein
MRRKETMNFEEVFLEAIDEEFSCLGETGKRTIYFYLETKYKIKKHDIPVRIEAFTEAIEDIFGTGAKLLEIRILKNLFKKIGHIHPSFHNQVCLEFTKYLESARRTSNRLIPLEVSSQCISH